MSAVRSELHEWSCRVVVLEFFFSIANVFKNSESRVSQQGENEVFALVEAGPHPVLWKCRESRTQRSWGGLLAVELIHRAFDPRQGERLDEVGGGIQTLRHRGFLLGGPLPEHIVHLSASCKVVADPEAETGVGLRAQHFGNVAQAVVPSVRTFGLQTQCAEGKGEVVADYQQAVRGQTVVVEVVADGFSAEVHVGGRFEQHQDFVLELDLGGGSQAVGVEAPPVPPGEVVQDAESDVVSRMGVFGADVSQSGYQVFFHGACSLFSFGQRYGFPAGNEMLLK